VELQCCGQAFLDKPELAITRIECGMRLSPFDPLAFLMQNGIATGHFAAGSYDEAIQ
jgi:hypothetical protein